MMDETRLGDFSRSCISPEVYQQVMDKLVYFLMKRRLSNDLDPEPPLFPWETEVTDYTEDSGDLSLGDADSARDGHDKTEPPPPAGPSA